jgi:hypothetical protein
MTDDTHTDGCNTHLIIGGILIRPGKNMKVLSKGRKGSGG